MNSKQLLKSWFAVALGVLIASNTVSGIYYDNGDALLVAILLLGIFNSFLKPILMLFSLPFIVLTFGIGIWIINAALFLLAAAIVKGFYVESFISALLGALIVSIIKGITIFFFGGSLDGRSVSVKISRNGRGRTTRGHTRIPKKNRSRRSKLFTSDDDVIDI